jgi:hypothetical protein
MTEQDQEGSPDENDKITKRNDATKEEGVRTFKKKASFHTKAVSSSCLVM